MFLSLLLILPFPDALAGRYSNLHRSFVVLNFVFLVLFQAVTWIANRDIAQDCLPLADVMEDDGGGWRSFEVAIPLVILTYLCTLDANYLCTLDLLSSTTVAKRTLPRSFLI